MLRIENKMIAPLFDRDWNAWMRRKILSCMWGNNWSCCPLETGRPRRAIQWGWKSWMKWQIFLPKKANSLCWSRYAGWRFRRSAGWTRARYPPALFLPPPDRQWVIFPGDSALRQGLHLSPSAILAAVLRLRTSLLREAKSNFLLPALNHRGPGNVKETWTRHRSACVHMQCARSVRSVLVAICALVTEKMRQNASKVHGVHGVHTRALFFRTQLAGALLTTFSVIFEHFETFLGR